MYFTYAELKMLVEQVSDPKLMKRFEQSKVRERAFRRINENQGKYDIYFPCPMCNKQLPYGSGECECGWTVRSPECMG